MATALGWDGAVIGSGSGTTIAEAMLRVYRCRAPFPGLGDTGVYSGETPVLIRRIEQACGCSYGSASPAKPAPHGSLAGLLARLLHLPRYGKDLLMSLPAIEGIRSCH